MGWQDGATMNQIGAWLNMARWQIRLDEETALGDYLKNHVNRKQMSDELSRIRDLKIERRLTRERLFDSPIWKDYEG